MIVNWLRGREEEGSANDTYKTEIKKWMQRGVIYFCHFIQIWTENDIKDLGPYIVHFKHRDSPYIVHFKRRNCPYVVHFIHRDCPYV